MKFLNQAYNKKNNAICQLDFIHFSVDKKKDFQTNQFQLVNLEKNWKLIIAYIFQWFFNV